MISMSNHSLVRTPLIRHRGVMGGLLTLPSFTKVFPEIDTTHRRTEGLTQAQADHKSTIQGISVASYNVGCFCGAIACIWNGNWLGRRKIIFLGSAIMVVGAMLRLLLGPFYRWPCHYWSGQRTQHLDRSHLAIRMLQVSSTWTTRHD